MPVVRANLYLEVVNMPNEAELEKVKDRFNKQRRRRLRARKCSGEREVCTPIDGELSAVAYRTKSLLMMSQT